MPPKNDDSPIESLQQTLDTPAADVSQSFARAGFHREGIDTPTGWAEQEASSVPLMSRISFSKKHHTIAKWSFGIAAVFFVIALGIAAFFLTGDRNILSADKIDIVVTGPSTISAGEILPLAIEIKNDNASTLEVADLLIEYPTGTRSADNVSEELLRVRMGLGNLAPGSKTATTTKAIIFGEEKTKQQIVVSLEYRVAGSNAIFVKKRAFTVEIDDSPVALSVEAPTTINSGDEVKIELTVRSNSTAPIENVLVKAEYPFGFEFASATPDPSFGETIWSFGDLEPEGERTLTLRGTLEGQNDEERVFRFDLGVEEGGDVTDIGTSFAQTEHTILIARPFMDLGLSVGGDDGDMFSARTGQDIDLEITWRNNLSGKLADAVVELVISGDGVNEKQIRPGTGFYDSSDNTVTWDKRTLSALALLDAGESGRAGVTLQTLSRDDLAGKIVNPQIDLALLFRGMPVSESDVPEQIRSEAVGTIRIDTDAELEVTMYHDDGPLANSGPIPPRAETETTYTVLWEASSSVNDVTGARVSAKLPPYVSWKGIVSPADEDITFDPSTGQIEWSIGTIRAGAGYSSSARSVAFQIGLIPSITQVGQSPTLIQDASLSGTDGFTGSTVEDSQPEQTTVIDGDSGFKQADGRVED